MADELNLPNITKLIGAGQITIGTMRPMPGCVAVAHDGRNSFAMLVCRPEETLAVLLGRLDVAIGNARSEGVRTDEVNTPGVPRLRR